MTAPEEIASASLVSAQNQEVIGGQKCEERKQVSHGIFGTEDEIRGTDAINPRL
jgi:hypothetical protein